MTETVRIDVSTGALRGLRENGIDRSSASRTPSPVGAHRFAAPVPARPWTQERTADSFGATRRSRPTPARSANCSAAP